MRRQSYPGFRKCLKRRMDARSFSTANFVKSSMSAPISSRRDAQLGIPHGKAATLRKAGRLGYGAGGEERAIPKSVHTRRSHQEQRAQEQYDRTPTTPIHYFNSRGDGAYDYFWKGNLLSM